MTTSIGALWGAPPAPSMPAADVPAGTVSGACEDGASFRAIAERLAKGAEPQAERPVPDDATLGQAVVLVLPAPPPPDWALPKSDAGAAATAVAEIAATGDESQTTTRLPASLPLPGPRSPGETATAAALLPQPLKPETIATAAAAQEAPPFDLGPAGAVDAGTNATEQPSAAQPHVEPPSLLLSSLAAPSPEPIPGPVPTPEAMQGRDAVAALVPHAREPQPGGLSVSGMRAVQEVLSRPVGAVSPRSAVAPEPGVVAPVVADAAPGIIASVLSAATSLPAPSGLPGARNQDTSTAAGLAARRTGTAVVRPDDLAVAEGRRSPATAVTARDTRRSSSDPLEPFAGDASRGPANGSQPEMRFALGLAGANGPKEMQFQPEARVHTAQVPEMIATQERIAAEMATLVRAGGGEARLDLEPAELGKLRLRLTVRNRVVEGSITVENPAVKAALEANMQGLVVALERSGLSFERMDVRLVDSRRGQERRENKRDSEASPKGEPGTGEAPATTRAAGRRGAGSGLVDYWY